MRVEKENDTREELLFSHLMIPLIIEPCDDQIVPPSLVSSRESA
jgi:hypothetical protein